VLYESWCCYVAVCKPGICLATHPIGVLAAACIGLAGLLLCVEGLNMFCGSPTIAHPLRYGISATIQLTCMNILFVFTSVQRESLFKVVSCIVLHVAVMVGAALLPKLASVVGSTNFVTVCALVVVLALLQLRLAALQRIVEESGFVAQNGQAATRRAVYSIANSSACMIVTQIAVVCAVYPIVAEADIQVLWFSADALLAVVGVLPIFREAKVARWALEYHEVREVEYSFLTAYWAWLLPR